MRPGPGTLLLLSILIGGCSSVSYGDLQGGRLEGTLRVIWIDQGSEETGDGRFLYLPDVERPLTFTRPNGKVRGGTITPGPMYTDGGSIPKIFQTFGPLSPWGYAPAYIVHDWLFEAHHCFLAGTPESGMEPVKDVTFTDSVEIIGEVIRTLQENHLARKDPAGAGAVVFGVGSFIAWQAWNKHDACREEDRPKPSNDVLAAAAAALPPAEGMALAKALGRAAPTPQARKTARARVLATFTY